MSRKFVLLVGLDPRTLDFSALPGLDERKLVAGLDAAAESVRAAGFDTAWCLTGPAWDSAGPQLAASLREREPAAVLIGAGVRTLPDHFLLFERMINLVHEAAPAARLCFNTSPDTTLDAVLRWVQP